MLRPGSDESSRLQGSAFDAIDLTGFVSKSLLCFAWALTAWVACEHEFYSEGAAFLRNCASTGIPQALGWGRELACWLALIQIAGKLLLSRHYM